MKFTVIVCTFLLALTEQTILLSSTSQLTIKLTNSVPIYNTTSSDTCFRLEMGSSVLYHLSSSSYYQAFSLN